MTGNGWEKVMTRSNERESLLVIDYYNYSGVWRLIDLIALLANSSSEHYRSYYSRVLPLIGRQADHNRSGNCLSMALLWLLIKLKVQSVSVSLDASILQVGKENATRVGSFFHRPLSCSYASGVLLLFSKRE
jgi:hypothetical protein